MHACIRVYRSVSMHIRTCIAHKAKMRPDVPDTHREAHARKAIVDSRTERAPDHGLGQQPGFFRGQCLGV